MRTGLKLFDKKVVNIVIDENRVERDVDYDGPLAPVTGSWTENAPDAQVTSRFVLLALTTRPPVSYQTEFDNVTVY